MNFCFHFASSNNSIQKTTFLTARVFYIKDLRNQTLHLAGMGLNTVEMKLIHLMHQLVANVLQERMPNGI